jgi:hypothetical protein
MPPLSGKETSNDSFTRKVIDAVMQFESETGLYIERFVFKRNFTSGSIGEGYDELKIETSKLVKR